MNPRQWVANPGSTTTVERCTSTGARICRAWCAARRFAVGCSRGETSFGVRGVSRVYRVDGVINRFRRELPTVARYLDDRIVRWRTGTTEGQLLVLSVLIGMSGVLAV